MWVWRYGDSIQSLNRRGCTLSNRLCQKKKVLYLTPSDVTQLHKIKRAWAVPIFMTQRSHTHEDLAVVPPPVMVRNPPAVVVSSPLRTRPAPWPPTLHPSHTYAHQRLGTGATESLRTKGTPRGLLLARPRRRQGRGST